MEQEQQFTLEQIIETMFDFSEYSEADKQQTISDTAGMVMEAALLKSLGEGGEQVQADFDTFMDTEPDDMQMNEYIQTKIPDFQKYVIEELEALKKAGQDFTAE